MKKRRCNRGSAVIEMTLLMPVILGVVYLYILLFLFLINSGKTMKSMAEVLYYADKEIDLELEDYMEKTEQGNKISIFVKDTSRMFDMELELHRNADTAVENIRRWQFATDTVRKRGDE